MPSTKTDSFANIAALEITESAANTQTVGKFAFPFSIMDKMGLIIERIEYDFTNLTTALTAAADKVLVGIIAGSSISDPDDPRDPILIDGMRIARYDAGTAASGSLIMLPYVKDFTNLSGGGILVAPNPLYGFVQGISAAAAAAVTIRMFYTYIELATDEYWQLVESRRIITS